MDIYDFGSYYAQTYSKECTCGKEHLVSTQKDEAPEYITEIYIKCTCGESVPFELPVN